MFALSTVRHCCEPTVSHTIGSRPLLRADAKELSMMSTHEMFPSSHHAGSHYRGRAVVTIHGRDIEVDVELKGRREPIDGVFRWFGRISENTALIEMVGDAPRIRVRIRTLHSARDAWIGDLDPWNRLRVTGKSTPPFEVPTALSAEEKQ
jgi:hypothetical protein